MLLRPALTPEGSVPRIRSQDIWGFSFLAFLTPHHRDLSGYD